jgi:hypothetical protein
VNLMPGSPRGGGDVNRYPQTPRALTRHLLHYPGAPRVFGDIEMQDPAPAVFEDEEAMQDPERQRWHREQADE